MDVYTDQHTISQDFPSKNNILIDEPDFSDKEEWPTEECFELLKFSNGEIFLMEYTE